MITALLYIYQHLYLPYVQGLFKMTKVMGIYAKISLMYIAYNMIAIFT